MIDFTTKNSKVLHKGALRNNIVTLGENPLCPFVVKETYHKAHKG
jgi:hypothetical protein